VRHTVEARTDRLFRRRGYTYGFPVELWRKTTIWRWTAQQVALHDLWRSVGLFRVLRWLSRLLSSSG